MSEVAGVGLVFIASTLSSVGMNFQKLAHRQTDFHDPRTLENKRNVPLDTNVYYRPYMILGFVMSLAAILCDSIALLFIGTTTIGVLGCMAIPINVVVSRFLLYEEIKNNEKFYIGLIMTGCLICLITTQSHEPIETFIRFSKAETGTFIFVQWCFVCLLLFVAFFINKLEFQLLAFGVSSGILGSQFVTMGKFLLDLTWLIQNNIQLPPTLQIVGVIMLLITALTGQIITLNKALEKFNATHAVAIFQCTWCVFNVVQGIVVFGDMEHASDAQALIFVIGLFITFIAVIGLSKQIGGQFHAYSDHSPSSFSSL